MRLFITQGGLFSVQEAAYHGVPVLGLPVYYDQDSNIDKVVAQGWGEVIQWEQLSEEILKEKITALLSNSR